MAILTVSTVAAAIVPAGQLQIIARTRMGKDKKEIPADKKQRSILISDFQPNVSSKYMHIVVAALCDTAKAQLEAQWSDNPDLREVDSTLYTEDNLLLFAAREAESKKLNSASILAFWNQSELKADLETKYTAGQIKRFVSALENLAAPVLSADFYNEEKAIKRIATLGTFESDVENETCQQMIRKLNAYVERIQKARAEIGDVQEIDA